MDVTVLGAAGGAGQAITAELAGRGHEVTDHDTALRRTLARQQVTTASERS